MNLCRRRESARETREPSALKAEQCSAPPSGLRPVPSGDFIFLRAGVHGAARMLILMAILHPLAQAQTPLLGDIDGDRVATVRDIALIAGHMNGTAPLNAVKAEQADINRDGTVNDADIDELVQEILQTRNPELLPLATVQSTSPFLGESDVAVTRETIVQFSIPLAVDTVLDNTTFYAEFGGRRLLSRPEISSDRAKATLFYLEPLPSNAQIAVTLKGTGLRDLINRPFDGDEDGAPGGDWSANFSTLSITPVPGTAMSGRVFASERGTGGIDRPLAGVTITVDGAEETLRTVTDSLGNFILNPCPAGPFFVHIDGRTSPSSAWPNGDYYPVVGKQWDAVAGRTNNLAGSSADTDRGTIYLPLIRSGTLQTASQTQDTAIAFPPEVVAANPALAGTRIDIPANSLFSNDGTRGGRVGIAPVAPDRIPSPLPPGLNLPIVITVQTDGGSNFDRPVPVTFPNLPDPVTGQALLPGQKSALWSFNHDLGNWEIVGPMTVTDDGRSVVTDAGVGILQPGWHGQQPGSQGDATPPPTPAQSECKNPIACCNDSAGRPKTGTQLRQARVACIMAAGAGAASGIGLHVVGEASRGLSRIVNKWVLKRFRKGAKDGGDYLLNQSIADGEACVKIIDKCLLDMFANGGTKRNNKNNKASEAEIDRLAEMVHMEWLAIMTIYNSAKPIEKQIESIINSVTDPNQLSEDQRQAIAELDSQYEQLFGKLGSDAFYNDRVNALLKAGSELQLAAGLFMQVPGFYSLEDVTAGTIMRGKTLPKGRLSLVLGSTRRYVLRRYFSDQNVVIANFITSNVAGSRTAIGGCFFVNDGIDSDSDGIHDIAENVLGTNPKSSDTDGDGISDGAEVKQGTNPLDGLPVSTGVIASGPTTAPALDVAAANNLAVTANGTRGITVFNALSGLNPTRVAEVDTPGSAMAVATSVDFVAVADGFAGLAVVDLTNREAIGIRHQIWLGGVVVAVATSGPLGVAGTNDGKVHVIDLPSGSRLGQVALESSGAVLDLAVSGDVIYALQSGRLSALHWRPTLVVSGSTPAPGPMGAGTRRPRVFAGTDTVYTTHIRGFDLFDTMANPEQPSFIRRHSTAQLGWTQLVANGSGFGIAVSGTNGPSDIYLYTLGADGRQSEFLTILPTPGRAAAAAILNGLAYVADTNGGLQILNYLAYDNKKLPPTISLRGSFALEGGVAEEGSLMRLTASVVDDVQVRNVEFYVDDALIVTDGNYPFECRFVTPAMTAEKTNFRVKARATDTGGNATWSTEYVLALVPDATPPTVAGFVPEDGWVEPIVSTVAVRFTEPVAESSLPAALTLKSAGGDGTHGTGDDISITSSAIEYSAESGVATLVLEAALEPGRYEIRVAPPLSDVAGNVMAQAEFGRFIVPGPGDLDADDVPDDFEPVLGLDPTKRDTNGNGRIDGDEDSDGDGISNSIEIALGLRPHVRDSDGNGIADGLEDRDQDGLLDFQELAFGTDWLNPDTDADGIPDEAEVTGGSNPLDPTSTPYKRPGAVYAQQAQVLGHRFVFDDVQSGFVHAVQPPINVFRLNLEAQDIARGSVINYQPPVEVQRLESHAGDFHIATPPVNVNTKSQP